MSGSVAMLTAALVAGALASEAPVAVVVVVAFAAVWPGWFLAAVVGWAIIHRLRRKAGPGPDDEARFLQGVAAELQAGASLRAALAAAAQTAPDLDLGGVVRRAVAGRPAVEVGGALRSALPGNGRVAAAALRLASATGARSAGLFAGLAVRAAEHGELSRERKALTAQARLSAVVVGGAPLVFASLMAVSGKGASLVDTGPQGLALLLVGITLEALGAGAVWLMLRQAER